MKHYNVFYSATNCQDDKLPSCTNWAHKSSQHTFNMSLKWLVNQWCTLPGLPTDGLLPCHQIAREKPPKVWEGKMTGPPILTMYRPTPLLTGFSVESVHSKNDIAAVVSNVAKITRTKAVWQSGIAFVFARWQQQFAIACSTTKSPLTLWGGGGMEPISHNVSLDPTNAPAKWHPNLLNGLSRVHECDRRQTDRPRYAEMCRNRRNHLCCKSDSD